MPKTTTSLETPLRNQLDRLAAFEPTGLPVISLYLDMRRDQQGREHHDSFLRKAFGERVQTFRGAARQSFEQDVERIKSYLAEDVRRSAHGLAIFACSGAKLFETVQLEVPTDAHWLFIGSVPHLYPLARLNDQYPRYAALLVDTNSARLFVFSRGTTEAERQVQNIKTRKTAMGGWSQARYQRHTENFHLHHMKDVVEVLDRVVREESINQVVVSCEEVARPLLFQALPKHLAEKVVDVVKMDVHAPDHQVLKETLDALRGKDLETDAQRVESLIGAWRAGGLAVVGPEDTMNALVMGQVEELLITATPSTLRRARSLPPGSAPGPVDVESSAPNANLDPDRLKLADQLVTKAQQTSARIRFIEDPELLKDVGGVGALLRFKI
ncbi:MAG TPA: Vms1/Ankzf1 family peptidyl-tRNA hydrolase [Vicinamibacterales bacterium]|jgi:peptide subunit release factor 1 (eRF1)|nr:Vms1/Ankzf1 family peptidyl-tRNA hydrolase [Vicinamibacterales bacterium]